MSSVWLVSPGSCFQSQEKLWVAEEEDRKQIFSLTNDDKCSTDTCQRDM